MKPGNCLVNIPNNQPTVYEFKLADFGGSFCKDSLDKLKTSKIQLESISMQPLQTKLKTNESLAFTALYGAPEVLTILLDESEL